MPSPVGHALAGCCLAAAAAGRAPALRTPLFAAALVAAAGLPDLDFLGVLLGAPTTAVHQAATHSVAFALAAAALLAFALRGRAPGGQAFGWLAAAGLAHLALDLVTYDALPPIGMPLLWPLSDARWHAPVTLFPGSDRARLFSARNWLELAAELAWLLPPLLVLARGRLFALLRGDAGAAAPGAAGIRRREETA